jgi:hypothetical protein
VSAEFTDAYHDLGRQAGQVVFAAVNVNQYHHAVADVAAYSRAHLLTSIPSWHFFTGPVPRLRAVWNAYNIAVQAPGPDADIVHSSVVDFIDPGGRERYLAARPFPPRTRRARRRTPWLPGELPAVIAACGLQVERVEPIPSVAAIADTVMVAARTTPVRQPPGRRGAKPRPFGPYPVRDRNRARWPEDPAGRIRVVRFGTCLGQ